MEDQEHSCALRALTLCDGQEAPQVGPRTVGGPCYCDALSVALAAGDDLAAQRLRTDRARVVARSADYERRREQRSWMLGPAF